MTGPVNERQALDLLLLAANAAALLEHDKTLTDPQARLVATLSAAVKKATKLLTHTTHTRRSTDHG